MQRIVSCDWGTSALRLRFVDTDNMSVFGEVVSDQGISFAFDLWKQTEMQESRRLSFYESILDEQIKKAEEKLNISLQHLPLVISGMASSNIGMMELPYKEIPFSTSGRDLLVEVIDESEVFKHKIFLISGIKAADDVMRGEETQLIGCVEENDMEESFFILPGTHSKHVSIRKGEVEDFKTYMTGEVFQLLSEKSILSNTVGKNENLSPTKYLENFKQGVSDSLYSNILHSVFHVRINQLFNRMGKEENYYYLSGLLIGTEIKGLADIKIPVTIIANDWLMKLYGIALDKIGVSKIKYHDTGKAVIKGHCKIYNYIY